MQNKIRTVKLSKETLRQLEDGALPRIRGGVIENTDWAPTGANCTRYQCQYCV